jgi:peptide/nickel transport system ATP-binding protein
MAEANELYTTPKHPYTEALLSAVPRTDPDHKSRRIILAGDVPSPSNPPPGCKFHPRCRYVQDICRIEEPELLPVGTGHFAACHFANELTLIGIDMDE